MPSHDDRALLRVAHLQLGAAILLSGTLLVSAWWIAPRPLARTGASSAPPDALASGRSSASASRQAKASSAGASSAASSTGIQSSRPSPSSASSTARLSVGSSSQASTVPASSPPASVAKASRDSSSSAGGAQDPVAERVRLARAVRQVSSDPPAEWEAILEAMLQQVWRGELEQLHEAYHGSAWRSASVLERRDTEAFYADLLTWSVARKLRSRYAIALDAPTRARFAKVGCEDLVTLSAVDPLCLARKVTPRGAPGPFTMRHFTSPGDTVDGKPTVFMASLIARGEGDSKVRYLMRVHWALLGGRWHLRSLFALQRLRDRGQAFKNHHGVLRYKPERFAARLERAKRLRAALDDTSSLAAFLAAAPAVAE